MTLTIDDLATLDRLLSDALCAVHTAPDKAQRHLEDAALALSPPEAGVLPARIRRRLADYVEANLERPLRSSALAEVAGLSASWLARAFRASFGCSPQSYVQQRRIARAKAQMTQTRLALVEIALDCGFSDQTHLCRVFRQETGMSPSQWRSTTLPDHNRRGDKPVATRVA